ncbi:MAG: HAD hydrolase-like protein [Candidatus Heimdallarchaeota archaeon]|nr:MAG: HAD hydrolase-like protein [Candidatus Heimdallarchaeota archaeon]
MNVPIKLLIFDLDDTLIHSNINYSEIRHQIAELFPVPVSTEMIMKTPILGLLKRLKRNFPDKFPEGYRRIDEAERKATKTATVIQGAEKIPLILKKHNLYSAIYTNNSKSTIELYLANPRFNFLKEFQILTREDFNNPKPDPEGLIAIIDRFQDKQITKENTAYIGDSYIDAITAHRANIKFVWFHSREIDRNLFPTPPYVTLTDWANFESILLGQ